MVEVAMRNPEKYVAKPQREGGGKYTRQSDKNCVFQFENGGEDGTFIHCLLRLSRGYMFFCLQLTRTVHSITLSSSSYLSMAALSPFPHCCFRT